MNGDVLMAGVRDASWYNYPDTRSVKTFHVSVCGAPACNQENALLTHPLIPAEEVPEGLRCGRPGCRARWGNADAS